MRNEKRSQRSIVKPASSIRRSISRARWQPRPDRGVGRSLTRPQSATRRGDVLEEAQQVFGS
jgi:2-keto-3-deoxy-L-rhamnonate aldolase RhmA